MQWTWPKTRSMLRREAARWLARLQSGRDPDVQRKFDRWLHAHPRHAAAFEQVSRSYSQAGLLRQSVVLAPQPVRVAAPAFRWAVAASIAAAVLVPAALLLLGFADRPLLAKSLTIATKRGEIREVALADGSRVTLDTSSRVQVQIDRRHRRAVLERGRARFRIAAATDPFVVTTATAVASSRDAVVLDADGGSIAVLAGQASVSAAAHAAAGTRTLTAGQTVVFHSPRDSATAPSADWTRGLLTFNATPLSDVVHEANRYSARPIELDEGIGNLRVTGAYRAGDNSRLAKSLASALGLVLTTDGSGPLRLSRPSNDRKKNYGG